MTHIILIFLPWFSCDAACGIANDGLQQKSQAEAVADKKDDDEVDDDNDDYIEEVQGQRSLFILGMRNPVRRAAIAVVEWVYFDVFIFSVIALNVIFMAIDDPVNPAPSALRISINSAGSYFFMAVFSLECLIKIVAMGFIIGKKAYLRDMWNVLDFFIVITGLIDLFLDQSSVGQSSGSTFDAFRPLRLLRPLRTLRAVGRFKKLRITVSLFSSCLPKLVHVGYLQIFIFFVFGTIACQLWQGLLRGRCYSHVILPSFQIFLFTCRVLAIHLCLATGRLLSDLCGCCYFRDASATHAHAAIVQLVFFRCRGERSDFLLAQDFGFVLRTINGEERPLLCSSVDVNGQSGMRTCPPGYSCLRGGRNPFGEAVHFDNFLFSVLAVFQVCTLEGWNYLMYAVQDTFSFWSVMWFTPLIMIGPFFTLQLILATIANRYADGELQKKSSQHSSMSLFDIKVGIISSKDLPRMDTFGNSDPYIKLELGNEVRKTFVITNTLYPVWNQYFIFQVTSLSAVLRLTMYDWNRFGEHEFIGMTAIPVGKIDDDDQGSDKWYEMEEEDAGAANGVIRVRLQWRKSEEESWTELPYGENELDDSFEGTIETQSMFAICTGRFRAFAESRWLSKLMSVIILLNLIAMALEHNCDVTDPFCRDLKIYLEMVNIVFIGLYLVEFFIKFMGLGPIDYFKNGTNILDFAVVALGILEAMLGWYVLQCNQQDPTADPFKCSSQALGFKQDDIRFIRIIRILRIHKLLNVFPVLWLQAQTIAMSAREVYPVLLLMLLVIVLFSILGMYLFGGLSVDSIHVQDNLNHFQLGMGAWTRVVLPGSDIMRSSRIIEIDTSRDAPFRVWVWGGDVESGEADYVWAQATADYTPSDVAELADIIQTPLIIGLVPRANFDSFFFSCLSTIQIMTMSDFYSIWFSCVKGTNEWAAIYFVCVIGVGNYVLFNIFAAIIIQVRMNLSCRFLCSSLILIILPRNDF